MFRKPEKYFRKTMTALAIDWSLVIGRVPDAVRAISHELRVAPRTPENWIQGRAKPSADNAVALMARFPEVFDAVMEGIGKRDDATLSATDRQKLLEARRLLAVLGED